MIVVDTNVLSEPLRPEPDPRVMAWLTRHRDDVAITAIGIGELRSGAARLPTGRRRTALEDAIERLALDAGDRLLPYGERAAWHYARIRARREALGRPVTVEDAMIAGICLAEDAQLATRNVRDFSDTGLVIRDPWLDPD